MPTTGYIQLQFNATYLGDYRVCWRLGNLGAYTCFTVNCGSLGLCTVYITPVSFPTNVCDDLLNYNGYVQASCENPETTDGAVFWNINYEPVTDCNPWEITCLGVTTQGSLSISVSGSGSTAFVTGNLSRECLCNLGPHWNATQVYNQNLVIAPYLTNNTSVNTINTSVGTVNWAPGTLFCGKFSGGPNFQNAVNSIVKTPCGPNDPATNNTQFGPECVLKPIVTIAAPPPGGTQATAEAIMGMGGLTSFATIVISNPGSGGTPGVYTVQNQNVANWRGKNWFNVTVNGSGAVSSIVPLNPPQAPLRGYYFAEGVDEYFTFNPVDIGNCTNVLAYKAAGLNSTDFGRVIGVLITNQGSGYLSPPLIGVATSNCSNPLGTTVNLQATYAPGGTGPCPSFVPGTGCGTYPGNISPTIPALPIGTSFILCYPSNVANPPWTLNDSWEVDNDVDACCYDCVDIIVQSTPANPTPQLVYTDFSTQNVTVFTMTSGSASISGVVNGSWASTSSDTIFTITGPCTL